MNEIWRLIPGHEGFYQVSDQGRVRSVDHPVKTPTGKTRPMAGRILQPGQNSRGYLSVYLYGKNQGSRLVHHLVALAFLGERPDGAHVHHLDGNKHNNTLINLEYVNASLHGFYHVTEGDQAGFMPILTIDQVVDIKARLLAGDTCKCIAADFGVSRFTISNIRQGRRWAWVEVLP